MAKTIVGELKDLYVKMGGNPTDLLPNMTTSEILDAIERIYNDKGDTLPVVTSEDNGKVLTVVEGEWNKADKDIMIDKVYFTGDTQPQGSSDITSQLTSIGNYYIKADQTIAASNSYTAYKCTLNEYIPTELTATSNSVGIYTYAFFSEEDPVANGGFISGAKCTTAREEETYTIDNIPENAKTAIFVCWNNTNFVVEGSVMTHDYQYSSVSQAVDQWKTDEYPNAVIYKKESFPTKVYRVGADRTPSTTEFTTVIDAVTQWLTDGKPTATIYVDSGIYITADDPTDDSNPLMVNGGEHRLTIVGESKESTIIKSTTGKYIHPAIDIRGGNVTLKNLTFIADHTTNAGFAFLDPDRQAQGKDPNSAYAIHCDSGSVGGVVEIENCNIWSWQSCGLGCGTIINSQIIVRNCDIRSFVPGTATDEYPTDPEKHAIYVHGTRGAIVYHTSSSNETPSNEGFTLIKSNVYITGGTQTMRLTNAGTAVFDMCTIIDNTFCNGIEEKNIIIVPDTINLNAASHGNNIDTVNAIDGYTLFVQ